MLYLSNPRIFKFYERGGSICTAETWRVIRKASTGEQELEHVEPQLELELEQPTEALPAKTVISQVQKAGNPAKVPYTAGQRIAPFAD